MVGLFGGSGIGSDIRATDQQCNQGDVPMSRYSRFKTRASTGLPDQEVYDEIRICRKCNVSVPADRCPKCGRKATYDAVEPRREKDLTDMCAKTRYEFCGISVKQALEILTNGDCSTER